METQELLKKVRTIEIKTRGLSNQIFSGEYHSAFKGRGMAFSEVREYQAGDEIRTIDWNVTARLGSPYVKVFEEERELTVMLLIDLSSSGNFGTRKQLKRQLITEVSAVLAFSAIQNNDKIGALFFTDKVEKFIPPKKGRSHILHIIRTLLNFEPENKQTNIAEVLRFHSNMNKKRTITFLLSDFMAPSFEDVLKIVNKKHDLVALQITDPMEMELPDIGLVEMENPETGALQWVNTSNKNIRTEYKANALKKQQQLHELFKRSGVDFAVLETHKSYIQPLLSLFKKREVKR